jgi:hypothetical protein
LFADEFINTGTTKYIRLLYTEAFTFKDVLHLRTTLLPSTLQTAAYQLFASRPGFHFFTLPPIHTFFEMANDNTLARSRTSFGLSVYQNTNIPIASRICRTYRLILEDTVELDPHIERTVARRLRRHLALCLGGH